MRARCPGSGLLAAGGLLLLPILTAFNAPAVEDEAEFDSYSLSHKAHKKWDFVLPSEKWHAITGGEIELGDIIVAAEQGGPMKLSVDTTGNGKPDKSVKGATGFLTIKGENDDGEKVLYSLRFRNQRSKYQWTAGGTMSGSVAGQMVHLIDQDGNGRFDDFGADALVVGKDKAASLLSSVALIGDKLYELEVDADGSEIRARPWTGETGTIDVMGEYEAKGKLVSAVFKSGDLSFNVAKKGGVKVPAGDYELVFGKLEKGSDSVLIKRGKMKKIEVEEGTTQKLEWGGPVDGQFSFTQAGPKVTVQGNLQYFGKSGEEYFDFQPRGKPPTIFVKDGRGKVLKKGRFAES